MNMLDRDQLHSLMDRAAAELQSRDCDSPASAVTEEADPEAAQASLDRLMAEWPMDLPLPGSSWRVLPSVASSSGSNPQPLPAQAAGPRPSPEAPVATGWPPRLPDRSFGYGLPRAANPDPDSSSDTGSSV